MRIFELYSVLPQEAMDETYFFLVPLRASLFVLCEVSLWYGGYEFVRGDPVSTPDTPDPLTTNYGAE